MRNFYFLFLLFCCSWIPSMQAQDQSAQEAEQIRQTAAIVKWDGITTAPSDFLQMQKTQWGLGPKDEFVEQSSSIDFLGMERIKFQQLHDGLPVIGAEYTVHRTSGRIKKTTGLVYPLIDCSTSPQLNQQHAELQALNFTQLHMNRSQKSSLKLNDLDVAESRLCIVDSDFPKFSGKCRLAYELEVTSKEGHRPVKEIVYVDAQNGNVIAHYSKVCHHNISSPASGYHYRDIHINVDSIAPNLYLLQDTVRNIQIHRVVNKDPFMLETELISNENNNWIYDEGDIEGAAADAMYCATAYYDFLAGHFNRKSIDDLNGPLICNVNVPGFGGETFFVNAFWDGTSSSYGAGDCDNYGPLTTLSIVSHEFTHGLTDYTSQLVYAEESGALNESISDIFGESLEFIQNPDEFSWQIGDELAKDKSMAIGFRDMSDPNNLEAPKYYKGLYWDTDQEVHTNSGVMNYWYYLIAVGDTSINEAGDTFALQGIGVESAIQIVYLMQTAYLTSTSDYQMAYISSISAAEDIFGTGAAEVTLVENAWKAVGVAERKPVGNNISLYFPSSWFFLTTCLDDEFISVDVIIENTGSDTLYPSEELLFKVFVGFEFQPVLIDTISEYLDYDLEPGGIQNFTLIIPNNGRIPMDRVGDYDDLKVSLLRLDDVDNDNQQSTFMQFVNVDPDLGMLYHELFYDGEECNEKKVTRLELVFENPSCAIIPAGTVFSIILQAGTETHIQQDSLFFDMEAGGLNFVGIEITDDILKDHFGSVNVIIDMYEDQNSQNDTLHLSGWNQRVLSTQSLSFENDLEGAYLQIELSETEPVGYLNDQWLAFTNLSLEYFDYVTCYEGIEGHYDVNASTKGSIKMCVDTRDMESPRLVFDAVFFDGFSALSFMPEHYATIFEVVINGERQALIYEQEDGEVYEYSFDLPLDFIGEIEIYAATFLREEASYHELGAGAWILFDDFRIEGLTSTTYEKGKSMTLYPNPVSHQLFISESDMAGMQRFQVLNLLGQVVIAGTQDISQASLDVSGLPVGSYILQMVDLENNIYIQSFLIQR